jgi:hypothetical protein
MDKKALTTFAVVSALNCTCALKGTSLKSIHAEFESALLKGGAAPPSFPAHGSMKRMVTRLIDLEKVMYRRQFLYWCISMRAYVVQVRVKIGHSGGERSLGAFIARFPAIADTRKTDP